MSKYDNFMACCKSYVAAVERLHMDFGESHGDPIPIKKQDKLIARYQVLLKEWVGLVSLDALPSHPLGHIQELANQFAEVTEMYGWLASPNFFKEQIHDPNDLLNNNNDNGPSR
ncbi:hypothetical protein [Oenococcus sp.]|uniref:hypothetical protein n=1 Tax=Oenococcus sp. TaxID=1979414 RepID=UPI0039EA7F5A